MTELTRFQHLQINEQASLFEEACVSGYDMDLFAAAYMTGDAAATIDTGIGSQCWMGRFYVLDEVTRRHGLRPCENFVCPERYSPCAEACFWTGWLYRYWHYFTGESSAEIYRLAGMKDMVGYYPGGHTLSPEEAINRIKEDLIVGGRDAGRTDFDVSRRLEVMKKKVFWLRTSLPDGIGKNPYSIGPEDYAAAGIPYPLSA